MLYSITSTKTIKPENQGMATTLAFALLPLSGFATDIYIPSLPSMASSLHVGSMQVQFTLTVFLISYGVAQLFVGSLLDSFGRYKISLIATFLFILASLAVAMSSNIYTIYAMRVVHGITVGAIIVAKRAYFVDMFTGDKLKHYLSMFSIIWSTGPIVAPFIGGYFQEAFGWRSNFYFLAFFGALVLVLEMLYSGESLQHFSEFAIKKITGIYATMIGTASFTLGIVMLGLAYSMVMMYNMTGPFIIEHSLHLTPVTAGYSSLVLGFAWMVGGLIGKASINKPFFSRIALNVGVQVAFVLIMLACLKFITGLYTLIFFAFIIHVCAGFTFNNFFTFCLSRFPKNAGIASGLTGGINYVIVSFLSYSVVAAFPAKDAHNLAYSYFVIIMISVAVMLALKFKKE
ncbi:MFS transporter [Mucilaginibacter daejeonensis]|uniref:MFS transporter n=1 Tax=Mucilaginibacter daejeonensis TaxID=398049 RepID=UPI001D179D8C|nr:MFS transporter [Mucilaginibacter daejeonensis]UEG54432.1 MFS transporter [Mucilaginibacter daejeonensis]